MKKTISESTKMKMSIAAKNRKFPTNWKGGRTIHYGYVLIKSPDHPFSNSRNYVQEHRLVIEKNIGRYLTKEEIVHHINGVKTDNRIENLQLMTYSKHSIIHRLHIPFNKNNTTDQRQCPKCKNIIKLNANNFQRNNSRFPAFGYICKKCIKIISHNKKP